MTDLHGTGAPEDGERGRKLDLMEDRDVKTPGLPGLWLCWVWADLLHTDDYE